MRPEVRLAGAWEGAGWGRKDKSETAAFRRAGAH